MPPAPKADQELAPRSAWEKVTDQRVAELTGLAEELADLRGRFEEAVAKTPEHVDRLIALEGRIERHSERIVTAEAEIGKIKTKPAPDGKPIVARLAAVMGQAARVEKKETHPRFGYKYAGVEAIMEAVNKAMAGEELILGVEQVAGGFDRKNLKSDGSYHRTSIVVNYTFYASNGEQLGPFRWEAEADDTQDKGYAKALTSSRKTFLRDFFLISFGDEGDLDPDRNEASGAANQGRQAASGRSSGQRTGQRQQAAAPAAQAPAQTPPAAKDPVAAAAAEAVKLAAKAAGLVNANGSASKALLEIVAGVAVPDRKGPLTESQRERYFDALEWVKAAHLGPEYDGRYVYQDNRPYVDPEDVTDPDTLTSVLGDWIASQSPDDGRPADATEAAS